MCRPQTQASTTCLGGKFQGNINYIGCRRSLIHNHPSGDPSPSKADIEMTRAVADVAAKLGITVHDHIVIARTGHASLRSMGLL